jgi:hypothetical protein
MIAANMKPMLAEEAKKRQLATLKKGTGSPVQVIFPERDKGQARDQAGLR